MQIDKIKKKKKQKLRKKKNDQRKRDINVNLPAHTVYINSHTVHLNLWNSVPLILEAFCEKKYKNGIRF